MPENLDGLATTIYRSGSDHSIFDSLPKYFDSLANYSNNNFFSKDTILSSEYALPKIEREFGSEEEIYSIEDRSKVILSDYWSHLSKQAVLHGAGVVRLFFEEVEKERKSLELFAKNKNLMDRVVGNVLNSWGLG